MTISAVSDEDPTKQDTATVTITEPQPLGVTISPKTADVTVKGTQQFIANVTGTSDTAVDWTIEGCDTCGTIDANGKYTAPDTVPAGAVTVKVALHADATKFDTALVTVKPAPTNAAKLNGKYVFVFSGYKGTGEVERIGNFTADGVGAITGEVIMYAHGLNKYEELNGTYTVGDDNRGEMTMTSTSASVTYRFVLKADGNGNFIEFDDSNGTGTHGAGEFKKEDEAALSNMPVGNFVLEVSGSLNARNRMGMLMQFKADWTTSANTTAEIDWVTAGQLSKHGTGLPVNTQKAKVDRLYLTVTPESSSYMFDVYMATPDEGFVVTSNSPNEMPYMVGRIRRQSGTFTKATLNGPTVFQIGGYDLEPGERTKTALGQVVFDGNGTFTGHIDQNDINDPQVSGAYLTYDMHGDYTVSANGRVQGNFFVGPSPQSVPLIFYLYAPNKGFIMDGVRTTDIVKDVNTGTLEPQTAGPFSSISGTFALGWTDVFTELVELPIGTLTFTADGKFSGTLDDDTGTLYPDQSVNGSYAVATSDAAFGRATMSVKLPDGTQHPLVLYSVSPTKFYGQLSNPDDGNGVVMTFEQ